MRKILLSLSALTCLSAPAIAMDYRTDNPLLQTVGWNDEAIEAQTQSAVYLRARIAKMEKENEQLRNSIHQMRAAQQNATSGKSQNSDAFNPKVHALLEENRRLSALLENANKQQAVRIDDSKGASAYAKKISALELERNKLLKENATLRNQKKTMTASSRGDVDAMQRAIEDKDAQVMSLKGAMAELQAENRKMGLALAESSKKVLTYHENANSFQSENAQTQKTVRALQQQLQSVKSENETLQAKLAQKPQGISAEAKQQIAALQKQNKSLGETIRAQNKVLVSADNATRTAERLITENKMLNVKLEQATKSNSFNSKSAKDVLARSQELEKQVRQRDEYIAQLEGLKDTVKQLRMQNDKYALGQATTANAKQEMLALQDKNTALDIALNQERENVLTYRTKIREYQEQIAAMQEQGAEKTSSELQAYQAQITDLQKEEERARLSLSAVQAENQELKARIKLLSQKTTSVVFDKSSNVAKSEMSETKSFGKLTSQDILAVQPGEQTIEYIRGEKQDLTEDLKKVKIIETSYPSVADVKPLLNENGDQIQAGAQTVDDLSVGADGRAGLLPEDLLAQGLKPLSK